MIVAVVVAAAIVVLLVVWLTRPGRRHAPPPIDSELATRVGIELHAVRRRLEVAWTRTQRRRDADSARREIEGLFSAMDHDDERVRDV